MFKRIFSSKTCFVITVCFTVGLFADATTNSEVKQGICEKIKQENLKTVPCGKLFNYKAYRKLPWAERRQSDLNEQLYPEPSIKRTAVFNLLNYYEKDHSMAISDVLDDGTWKDLEILCGPKSNQELYVATKVDRTVTEIGRATLYRKIIQPISNMVELQRQQAIIKKLVEDEALFNDLDTNLKKLAIPENVLLSFWAWGEWEEERDPLPFGLEEKFPILKRAIDSWNNFLKNHINSNEYRLMTWKMVALVGSLSALAVSAGVSFTAPAAWISEKAGWHIHPGIERFNEKNVPSVEKSNWRSESGILLSIGEKICGDKLMSGLKALALAGTAVGVYYSARGLYREFFQLSLLQKKLIYLGTYLDSLFNMIHTIKRHESFCALMPQLADLDGKIAKLRSLHIGFDHLLKLLATKTFKGNPSNFSFWERMRVAHELMVQEKDKFNEIMVAIGELDAQMSIARLYKESLDKRVQFCFPVYQESTDGKPFINIEKFWHPCLDWEKAVDNSLELHGKHMVITGPNAAGKSTIMKALVVSMIMAQSFGIAPASSFTFTPFSKIITYLNITDDIAAGNSHFKAGVMRARDVINEINKIGENQFSFTAVDELFNGTSLKEGQAAAYGFIELLGERKNNLVMSTTHFPLLVNLAKVNERFLNYKVYVTYDQQGKISYSYKLLPGIADQVITLKILKEEGFGDEFLKKAEDVLVRYP